MTIRQSVTAVAPDERASACARSRETSAQAINSIHSRQSLGALLTDKAAADDADAEAFFRPAHLSPQFTHDRVLQYAAKYKGQSPPAR